MKADNNFSIRKPNNSLLSSIIEFYFYIDIPVINLIEQPEIMIPFPRITFGYFFENPFKMVNHTLQDSKVIHSAVSRISTQKIDVLPLTDRIRILGAHLKPYGLACFAQKSIKSLPWLIELEDVFGNMSNKFLQKIDHLSNLEEMFNEVEDFFLKNILDRNITVVKKTVELVEKYSGDIELTSLYLQLNISDRTLRNYFYEYIGCSPKEYIRIVRMKFITNQLKSYQNSLTDITYNNNFFDQAHFINEIKNLTGQSPGRLRKDMPGFRFLHF